MPGKLDALTQRVGTLEQRMGETAAAVEENTVITRQIEQHTGALVEMVKTYTSVKTTGSVLKTAGGWLTKMAAGGITIGGAAAAAWHWVTTK